MSKLKIGISAELFGVGLRDALRQASRLGVAGVRISAVGDLSPANLSQTGRRELRNLVRSHDLALCAVHCPLRRGLNVAENLEARINHVRQVMLMAYELGPALVTLQAGSVPPEDAPGGLLVDALQALSAYGDRVGTSLALETGLDSGERLARFLKRFDTGSLGVNFDPANLLINGFQPVEDLKALGQSVLQVQAKDARRSSASRAGQTVPLGQGDIDWMHLLALLDEQEYRGWVVLHGEEQQSIQLIEHQVGMLRRWMP